MQLQELFNKTHEYKVTDEGDQSFEAQFESNGRIIEFQAREVPGRDDVWDIAFAELRKHGRNFTSSHEVTGSGDELAVFGTVMKILEEFMQMYKPKIITFTSSKDDRSRTALYKRLVDRFVKRGWKNEVDKNSSDYRDYFTLTKEE